MLTAEQLHELRLASGLSIYRLADRANVHWLTVLRAENPERSARIRRETRRRLEAALREAVEEKAVLVAAAQAVFAAQPAA